MSRVTVDITMSLDGFVAGPNATLENPLGEGGMQLHEWVVGLRAWRERHGMEGGEEGPDAALVEEAVNAVGATIMGRRMFSSGSGPWEEDPNANGWWGDAPPFETPVFVLTHHPRERVDFANGTSFTFVTDGIERALEQARAAAGDRNVAVAGGGDVVQQYLAADLVDDLLIHVAPVLLGGGVRLFADVPPAQLELVETIASPNVSHLRYRTPRSAESKE
jgi:dihydrofolate reductase